VGETEVPMIRLLTLLVLALWPLRAAAEFGALARIDGAAALVDQADTVVLDLGLSQGVPWRLFTLDAPHRLVMDFRELDFAGLPPDFDRSTVVTSVRTGRFQPGWTRMVLELAGPMAVRTAGLQVAQDTGRAALRLVLAPTDDAGFAATTGAPRDPRWDLPAPALTAPAPRAPGAPLIVVLDPGHGGIDPGADRDGHTEKALMLTFAQELAEELRRSGRFDVVLTRTDDRFVSLEQRVAFAHAMRADLFLSLHADALAEGQATGTALHLLSDSASDEATALLAERHDRDSLLSGVDLSGQDDQVAVVLMDLARMETTPRAEAMAEALIASIGANDLPLNRRPLRRGAFSVLKAADIPSLLIEVGFLSSPRDLANLIDPDFRARMAVAIRMGLEDWVLADAARAGLVRQ
jgi:N-acetylmuramoyl-L-alanine amidase